MHVSSTVRLELAYHDETTSGCDASNKPPRLFGGGAKWRDGTCWPCFNPKVNVPLA
jgi:hypothetical protein